MRKFFKKIILGSSVTGAPASPTRVGLTSQTASGEVEPRFSLILGAVGEGLYSDTYFWQSSSVLASDPLNSYNMHV